MSVYGYILSGGSGTRLWPVSRKDYPKQLQKLIGDETLLQQAMQSAQAATGRAPTAISNAEHRFQIKKQAEEIGIENAEILLEPVGRNTAPAAITAALHALERAPEGGNPVVLLMPSDHRISDTAAFSHAVEEAATAAQQGLIVTLGITPDAPKTGYGYIKKGMKKFTQAVSAVESFIEKPDEKTAGDFLAYGGYYWNSGIFVYSAKCLVEQAGELVPETLHACKSALSKAEQDLGFTVLDQEEFSACEDISIDYAIMEKTAHAAVLPVAFQWSDLGSWDAVWAELAQDDAGNSVKGDAVLRGCSDCLVLSDKRVVAGIGLEGLAVIDTDDALLVIDRKDAQSVGNIVNYLKARNQPEAIVHRRTYRPWGWFEQINHGGRYQVKILHISPDQKLSVQSHNHRSEHWVVVKGTVQVERGDETILLSENESTYIPLGVKHSLANPGKIPAQIIEVQTGAYLGEDDIIRYEDVYGRKEEPALFG